MCPGVCVPALTESDRRRPTLPRQRATLHQDGNGFIDVQELKEALQEWGQSAEAAGPGGALGGEDGELSTEELIREVDKNGDGLIDRKEFYELFRSKSTKHRRI